MRPEARHALLVATAGGVAAVALATPAVPVPVRGLAAASLAFALPGAAVLAALMPRIRWRGSERVALCLGGSLTITIATAFVLHASPGGLSAVGWAGLLGAVTIAGALVGWLRALRPSQAAAGPSADSSRDPWAPGGAGGAGVAGAAGVARLASVSPISLLMLVAAGLLLVVALVLARAGVALGPTASFAELWMLPAGDASSVRVGVANHEGGDRAYRLIVTLDGRRVGDPIELSLADGAAVDRVVSLPVAGVGDRAVEVRMWHADEAVSAPPLRLVRATLEARDDGA